MQAFLPAPLLRSLRRFAGPDAAEDSEDASSYSILTRGAVVGTQRSVTSSGDDVSVTQQIAVWGLLRLSTGDSFDHHLPGGLSRIGSFAVVHGEDSDAGNELESVALQVTKEDDGELVLVYELVTQTPRLFRCVDGKTAELELEVVQCLHARDFHRVVGFAPLRCAVDLHVLGDKSMLLHQLQRCQAATREEEGFYVRVGVQSKKGRTFRVLNARGDDALSPDAKPVLLEAILLKAESYAEETKGKKNNGKKSKKGAARQAQQNAKQAGEEDGKVGFLPSLEYGDIANLDLLVSLAPLDASAEVAAPVVTIPAPSVSKNPRRRFHAHCDALVVVPVDSSVPQALALLRQQLHDQLADIVGKVDNAPGSVASVVAHQFPLVGAAFPLMVISSSTNADHSSDDSMDEVETLQRLHRVFLQPMDQALFRVSRGCSLAQQGEWLAASDVLYNVHEGIPSSGVGSQGQQALVDGFYGYYHYLQQGMNDKGWGCAYRSLQTLSSWLFVQHYTQQRFLSHEQIQSALVKMGDKPARFQGSTEWIGSLEVGYVLDELFGVTFRSLSVSSGAMLPDVARELLYHFETQGTPVMMGGGQLAFTLLGVDYDPDAGVCAFLTLDPHYTGDEDLGTIQQQTVTLEGYKAVPCSWRKTTTFAKNSFYNLCLPQRPNVGV
ncbi:putative Ufm1-specific protease [Phytophthora ramorum]|uniref:putative Ufm1-specific protease n=1 Tax=Phytophthora ramorum TaxID=164328 RepID=UPI0030AD808E|nr:putative Ufm1-specific protease [Phytophthora ramorum]